MPTSVDGRLVDHENAGGEQVQSACAAHRAPARGDARLSEPTADQIE